MDNLGHSSLTVLADIEEIIGYKPTFFEADIRNRNELKHIFHTQKHGLIGVIHCAALKSVGDSCQHPYEYYDNNIHGTLTLLYMMEKCNVRNLIFSSSATVYDAVNNLPPFAETDSTQTTNPYGSTKLMVEMMIRDLSMYRTLNALSLRYFNPIGSHSSWLIGDNPNKPTNLLPIIMNVIQGKKDKLTIYGDDYETPDKTAIRDYIHVMDVAEAHVSALEHVIKYSELQKQNTDQLDGLHEVINIGTGKWTSVLEMVELARQVTGQKIPYTFGERRQWDVPEVVANTHKAQRVLHREARRTMYDAVYDAYKFTQHNI